MPDSPDPLQGDTDVQWEIDCLSDIPSEPDSSTLFDYLAGLEARDAAIVQVGEHAPTQWLTAARFAVLVAATELPAFTTDDVWQVLAELGIGAPNEPRAMGAVIKSLSRSHQIVGTGRFVPTARPDAHCRPAKEWELS